MSAGRFDLILLRHAASAAPRGHAVGQWNVPLSADGVEAIRHALADWPHGAPTRIVCSDLSRARATARAIAQRFDLPLSEDAGWREVSLGEWERRRWADLEREDGGRVADWYAHWRKVPAPGGEAWPDVIERVRLAFGRLAAGAGPRERAVVVAHVGAIRAFLIGLAGCSEDTALGWPLPPLAVVRARVACEPDATGRWPVELLDSP